MSDIKIGAAYIRVSTHDQEEYSPDSQLKMIRDYAAKNGIVVPDEYIFRDDGISGRKAEKRPEFMRMISIAKQKPTPFDVILVWKFSRFARNEEESIVYKSLLRRECKVDVISISEPIMDGPFGSLIERIIEWMDAFYSVRLAGEVKRGMLEKVTRGEAVSIPAFGYQIKDKQYIPDPDEAQMARKIFDDYLAGVPQREIAMRLNAMGYRTKRGNLFELRTIEYILQNPVYIGKIRWNPKGRTRRNYHDKSIMIVQGTHTPLITDEVFAAVQEKVAAVKASYAPYARQTGINYMLQGLVKCSSCGATMSRSHGDGLQCSRYSKGTCNVSHYVSIQELSQLFMAAVNAAVESKDFNIIHKTTAAGSDLPVYQAQLDKERRKLARIKDAYTSGIDTLDEYKANKTKVLASIAELEKKLQTTAKTKFDVDAYADRVSSAMREVARTDISEPEKNKIIHTFVDHAVFTRSKSGLSLEVFYFD